MPIKSLKYFKNIQSYFGKTAGKYFLNNHRYFIPKNIRYRTIISANINFSAQKNLSFSNSSFQTK
jgi:hypothetical protein